MSAIARSELLSRLAGVVGEERAAEIVDDTARALGLDGTAEAGVEPIVDRLAESRGAIGATVRLLRSRSRLATQSHARDVERPLDDGTGPRPSVDHANVGKLVDLLTPALGKERATELVATAIVRLSLDRRALGRRDGLAVLEALALQPGLTGTVARFAKARAHLELVD
jgi:hypothetical protein